MASSATRFAAAGMAALLLLAIPSTALAAESTPISVPKTAPSSPQVPPAPTISKEEALSLVKRHFKLPDGPGPLEVVLMLESGRPTWQVIYWVDRESTGASLATVDVLTGRIREADVGNRRTQLPPTGPLGQPHSEEEGLKQAWSLVQALLPEESTSLRPAPPGFDSYNPYTEFGAYNYTWLQYHNDVPVPSSMVRVTVDRYTLDAISYSDNLQKEVAYPPSKATFTPEQAFAQFQAAAVPVLRYRPIFPPRSPWMSRPAKPEMRLVYEMDLPAMLDAVTGKSVGLNGEEVTVSGPKPVPVGGEPVTAAHLPLAEADAIAIARQLLDLPPDAEPQVDARNEGAEMIVIAQDGNITASASLNRQTGMIRSAHRRGLREVRPLGEAAPPPTAEQKERARQEAIRAVQRLYSQQLPDLKLLEEPMPFYPMDHLNFTFQRYVHGIAYDLDTITVTVDVSSGRWTYLSTYWEDEVKVPEPMGIIKAQEAYETYFADRTAHLVYQPVVRIEQPPTFLVLEERPTELILVYKLALSPQARNRKTHGIDAFTGRWIPAGDTVDLKETDEKLTGHWAEGELRYALARRWITPATLSPDGTMTRLQALRLLSSPYMELGNRSGGNQTVPYKDIPQDDSLYFLVQQGIGSGMLRPVGEAPLFGGDEAISRTEFAVWIARLLGLSDLAKSGLSTEAGHTDLGGLTAEQRNAVAFLDSLGLLSSGGKFRGEDPLTQAEGAALVVRFMAHLRMMR